MNWGQTANMLIRFCAIATVHNSKGLLVAPNTDLSHLLGVSLGDDDWGRDLDFELLDLGICFEMANVARVGMCEVEVQFSFLAPGQLTTEQLEQLRNELLGQISDGLGECDIILKGRKRNFYLKLHEDSLTAGTQISSDRKVSPAPVLWTAARKGEIKQIEAAILEGTDLDCITNGYTALLLAVLYGQCAAATMLIQAGASVRIATEEGETPLHLCVLSNSLGDFESAALARIIIDRGCDINATDEDGYTALMYATCRDEKPALIAMLKQVSDRKQREN